ncbi:MAG: hypothetical protein A2014_12790 [Spirochaetes bacterium GWF1_49_6]|nr:MAG: hypothetical protein A2014_12790 [Spirochaetes bacterium GWF1_49_6]
MKPIFSIHIGEYLVGNYLEKKFKKCNLWIPSKDTGIDFLMTNSDNTRNVSFQVKYSKDFLPEMEAFHQDKLDACGWWTLNAEKIKNSSANFWIFAPFCFKKRNVDSLVIIDPNVLSTRLEAIHSKPKSLQIYFWIKGKQCWETRGLRKDQQEQISNNSYRPQDEMSKLRDFSSYLNQWDGIKSKLGFKQ